MPQSSLMAWLAKPKPATEPGAPSTASHDDDPKKEPAAPPEPAPPSARKLLEVANAKPSPAAAGLPPLPSNVELRACTKADIPALKRLISLLLPIPYPEQFFREILDDPVTADLTLLAFWHDRPDGRAAPPPPPPRRATLIGAIRCRLLTRMPGGGDGDSSSSSSSSSMTTEGTLEPRDPGDRPPLLYLSTVVLLAPYRSHGIASHLLARLVRRAVEDYGATRVGAHVWEANAAGLEWYAKRGFREVAREPGYYRRLSPTGAVVVEKGLV